MNAFALPLLVASSALASITVQMDVPALTAASTDVVDAQVVSASAVWTGDHRRIMTHVQVDVRETWKGTATGRITVVQPGGERDGLGQRVSGVAALVPGERVVLFLERAGDRHRVVGLAQGVYRVQPGEGGAEEHAVPASLEGLDLVTPAGRSPALRTTVSLSELRSAVRAAR
ncbi:MAG TPA: hypothetical protein VMT11_17695 [Myxococcaceae bacterium]|nr:hypothetical protein [Myxococcaceae bacterium]